MSALVAVSHGTADPRGRATVARLVDAVRDRLPDVDVRQAFVDVEEPELTTVLGAIDGPAVVVPLLLGAGFHVHVDIANATDAHAPTLGPDTALTGILADRLNDLRLTDADIVVLGVAGSSDIRARLAADRAGALLAARLRRPVRIGHLGGRGRAMSEVVAEARHTLDPGGRVIAASYLLAPGYFTSKLERCGADVVTAPLASGVHVDKRLVDLVVRRYAEAVPVARAS